jgi:hypothetical protein
MPETGEGPKGRWFGRFWPWLLLGLSAVPAVQMFTRFESGPDGEFPEVVRPTFSARPPAAYRWAEPGDTADRIGLYASAGAAVVALVGWRQARRLGRGAGLWPSAFALALAAGWDSATPYPTFDGWHGLNWRSIGHPETPPALRAALVAGAAALGLWAAGWAWASRPRWRGSLREGRSRGVLGLLAVAVVGVLYRVAGRPDVEPFGYWPRWAFDWGMLAFGFALLKALPVQERGLRRAAWTAGAVAGWAALVAGGLWLTWYHRPLERLRAVDPGKIYISAMPTRRGLEVAYARHPFKTIINVFNEDTPRRSPLLPDELAFAREHGIHYVGSPSDPLEADAFLDETLRLARDPDAWPILVHCHGCMDRTPAWMGIYRFVVQGWPLEAVLREIEGHRGLRPKALVTLLYNRVLRPRAPDHYDADPVAALLNRCARGAVDPMEREIRAARERQRLSRREPPGGAGDAGRAGPSRPLD